MPAAGRPDGKYVRKVHYQARYHHWNTRVHTRCGKSVPPLFATSTPARVTCRTCLRALGYRLEREDR
jgi:hypothetical protein